MFLCITPLFSAVPASAPVRCVVPRYHRRPDPGVTVGRTPLETPSSSPVKLQPWVSIVSGQGLLEYSLEGIKPGLLLPRSAVGSQLPQLCS